MRKIFHPRESISKLSNLPPEVLCEVLDHLPPSSQSSLSQTCISLRRTYTDFLLHKLLTLLPPTNRAVAARIAERELGLGLGISKNILGEPHGLNIISYFKIADIDILPFGSYLVLRRMMEDYMLVITLARCIRAKDMLDRKKMRWKDSQFFTQKNEKEPLVPISLESLHAEIYAWIDERREFRLPPGRDWWEPFPPTTFQTYILQTPLLALTPHPLHPLIHTPHLEHLKQKRYRYLFPAHNLRDESFRLGHVELTLKNYTMERFANGRKYWRTVMQCAGVNEMLDGVLLAEWERWAFAEDSEWEDDLEWMSVLGSEAMGQLWKKRLKTFALWVDSGMISDEEVVAGCVGMPPMLTLSLSLSQFIAKLLTQHFSQIPRTNFTIKKNGPHGQTFGTMIARGPRCPRLCSLLFCLLWLCILLQRRSSLT